MNNKKEASNVYGLQTAQRPLSNLIKYDASVKMLQTANQNFKNPKDGQIITSFESSQSRLESQIKTTLNYRSNEDY